MTTTWEIRPIPQDVVSVLRTSDDAGREPRLVVDDEGGSPLRCCLTRSKPGEQIALVSYAPLRRWAERHGVDPGPYDEVGPVFVHAYACGGAEPAARVPAELVDNGVCRAYAQDGTIIRGLLVDPGHPAAKRTVEDALEELFADAETAFVHVRAVGHGCFTYEAQRAA
ncbi:MAG TPA: DUF1203 domain-containing protein [Streptosporangiales bacterium]